MNNRLSRQNFCLVFSCQVIGIMGCYWNMSLLLKLKQNKLAIVAQKAPRFTKFLLIGWKLGNYNVKEDVTYSTSRTCEELLTSIFHACDTECRGKLKIICWNVLIKSCVLSIVSKREVVYAWCSMWLCLHTWWMQPNLGVRMAV